MSLPRVLIVDDHKLFADGLAEVLRGRCDVVGSIDDGSLLRDAATRLRPDVILLDVSMPKMSGLEALAQLELANLGCKVIMLTMYNDAGLAAQAFKAGALGFALKESSEEELLHAVETVIHGGTYLTATLAGDMALADRLRTERQLKRAEDEVNLLHTIVLEVAAAEDLIASLEIVLRRVCERTGWAIGQAWVPSQFHAELECSPVWCAVVPGLEGFRVVSEATRFKPGIGLPGRVWASGQPAWIRDVTVDSNFPRAQAAIEVGLKGAVAIPIVAGNQIVAVIEFFVQEPRDEDERLTKVIATVAAELNLALERKRTEDALRDREALLRHSFERIQELAGHLIIAQEAERTRIARELHDDVNQQLAALSVSISGLRRRLGEDDRATLEASLTALQQRVIGLVDSVRRLSHDLHPGVLQHVGLTAALESHCSEFQRQHDVEVTFGAANDIAAIEPDSALCLFRAAQEGLRNVAKHAGAQHVDVRLGRENGRLTLTIADDGRGFDATDVRRAGGGLGLLSIEERARLLQGSVRIDSAAGSGTTVWITIPATSASPRP